MSKKDYEMLAKAIREWSPNEFDYLAPRLRGSIARAIGSELLNGNRRFDLQRFVNACVRENAS
jgi:hypothetical protein